jgi:type I restriction enzyme S subunit
MAVELPAPAGWQLVKLSDLGEVNRGRSKHRPRHDPILYGGPYPFIQTGDVKASGGRITIHEQTYNDNGLAQSRLWPAGTMCITIAANIAETGILTFPACFPDSVIGFIADTEKCDVRFIEYTFRLLRKIIQFQAEGAGTVQDNINLEYLEQVRFPVPPLAMQRRIADMLGAFDDKLALNKRTSHTLQVIASAVFKSWFIDFDPVVAKAEGRKPFGLSNEVGALFPFTFSTTGLASEFRQIPQGWSVRALDEVATFLNGLALQRFRPSGSESLPVIKIAELRAGSAEGAERASSTLPHEYIIEDGDVIFSWSGSLMVDQWCGGPGALNQHLFKVTSTEFPKWFYLEWIRYHLPEFQDIAADKATTMGHIRRHHLSDAKVVVPPATVLAVADRLLTPMIERIVVNRVASRTLAKTRDALISKLLSGELELPVAAKQVEALA